MIRKTILCLTVVIAFGAVTFPKTCLGGEVRTKDTPKKGGGYHDESYHLKGKGHKEGFVNKEQNWRNPFRGFTGKRRKGKGIGPGEMPHAP